MPWEKINRTAYSRPDQRRDRPCVSRSPKRPDMAYMMLPADLVPCDRVSIYSDNRGRIAFEFSDFGEYAVRRTSATSYTARITIPKALVSSIRFGLTDVDLERNSDGWLILTP